jgi:heat shock protein HslJ
MYKTLTVVATALVISACSAANDSSKTLVVGEKSLQHHHWQLTKINGKSVDSIEHFKAPTLEIGENMTTNGQAGCNNFFGQGELADGKFRVEKMAMTMKICPDEMMAIEMAYSKALGQWSEVTLTQQGLTLNSDQHSLEFELKDWMH